MKVLCLDADILLHMFSSAVAAQPVSIEGLPTDYSVLSVNVDWQSHCVKFMVESSRFAPVPPGHEPPLFQITLHYSQADYIAPNEWSQRLTKIVLQ